MEQFDNEQILQKLEQLMEAHKFTRYKLAKQSGIKMSTITTIFNKRSTVSLVNLCKMCGAFGLPLSEFFASLEGRTEGNANGVFPREWWRSLSEEEQKKVSAVMFSVAELYRKNDDNEKDNEKGSCR